MADFLVTAQLQMSSGLADDHVVNNWAIIGANGWNPVLNPIEVTNPLTSFYTAIEGLLSRQISRSAQGIKFKIFALAGHLDGSPHGSPVQTDAGQIVPATSNLASMPAEVAIVATLRGAGWQAEPIERPDGADAGAEVDRPRQRYSGRVFLGPLSRDAAAEVSGGARPSGAGVTMILNALEGLEDALKVNGHHLGVWSRKNAQVVACTHVQVDDAFDTMRKRGLDPTARTTRVINP